MKRFVCLVCVMLLLTGCAVAQTFETVSDDLVQPVMAQMREVVVTLPDHAAVAVMNEEDGGKLYLCDGYTLTLQTMVSGDMDTTVRTLSGFSPDSLTILKTQTDGVERNEWVWSAVGEGGDQLCRAVVLDDGAYHYCMTVMADAASAGSLEAEWDAVFECFGLS